MHWSNTQPGKRALAPFLEFLADPDPAQLATQVLRQHHPQIAWHGPHPFNALNSAESLLAHFWQPLFNSFPDLQRRNDILMAGHWQGKDWVCSTGNYMGTFRRDWLGIPATGQYTWIRFGEFHHLVDDRIHETYLILDVLDVMRQAGVMPLPRSLGVESFVPGPATQDGLLLAPQDRAESARSLRLVEDMIADLNTPDHAWAKYWHPHFMWYGPAGIGTTRGIDGFARFHNNPWDGAWSDWKGGNHKARFAEGNYVASTGWPSIYATHDGDGLFGLAATGKHVQIRVMDWWRRDGELLAENWVFIDIIDLCLQLGLDLFERMRLQYRTTGKTA